ncbi:hypothetical protein FQA39_LY10530 [Lamprigera yunnana]|nr:hypothetical protein FQA39_LY10530 [Lamprigera yunnana]
MCFNSTLGVLLEVSRPPLATQVQSVHDKEEKLIRSEAKEKGKEVKTGYKKLLSEDSEWIWNNAKGPLEEIRREATCPQEPKK